MSWKCFPIRKKGYWGFEAAFALDLKHDLVAITAPTLVVTNSGEDWYEASKRTVTMHPHFVLEELEGGTHDIVDEQPGARDRSYCPMAQYALSNDPKPPIWSAIPLARNACQ